MVTATHELCSGGEVGQVVEGNCGSGVVVFGFGEALRQRGGKIEQLLFGHTGDRCGGKGFAPKVGRAVARPGRGMVREVLVGKSSFLVLVCAAKVAGVETHNFLQVGCFVLIQGQSLSVQNMLLDILLCFVECLQFFKVRECLCATAKLVIDLEPSPDVG